MSIKVSFYCHAISSRTFLGPNYLFLLPCVTMLIDLDFFFGTYDNFTCCVYCGFRDTLTGVYCGKCSCPLPHAVPALVLAGKVEEFDEGLGSSRSSSVVALLLAFCWCA